MLSNTQWIYLEIFLLCLLNQVSAIVDCTHGFVGRMQASLSDDYIHINDTRMCAADWCIQVVIHGAYDDDNTFQQGVSSRCGYTGGDRSICQRSQSCTQISFYDGMKGNFSFCCCRETECNRPTAHLIDEIYGSSTRKKTRSSHSFSLNSLQSTFLFITFIFLKDLVHFY